MDKQTDNVLYVLSIVSLMAAYTGLQLVLIILYSAYYYNDTLFWGSGGPWTFVLYEVYLLLLPFLSARYYDESNDGRFTMGQMWVLLLTVVACVSMTIASIADVMRT